MIFNYQRPADKYDSSYTAADMLKDLYGFYLEPKDQAMFDLIERYWKVLSYNKIRKWNELRAKGRKQKNPFMKDLIYKSNPFLNLIRDD